MKTKKEVENKSRERERDTHTYICTYYALISEVGGKSEI